MATTIAIDPSEKTYQYLKGKNIKNFSKTNEEWLLEMGNNPDAAERTYNYLAGQNIKGFPSDREQWLQAMGVKKKVSGKGLGVGGAGILEAERQAEITEQQEETERQKTTVEEPTPEDIATEGIAEILKPQEEPISTPIEPVVEAPKMFLQEEFEEERKAQIQELLKNEPLTDEEKKSIEEGGRPDIKSFMGKRALSNEEIFDLNTIVATDPSALQGEVPTEQDGTPVMEPTEKKLWDQAAKKLETKEKRASLIETAKKQLASIETQISEKPEGEPVLGHAPSAPGTVELETSKRLLENIINMAEDDSGAFMAFMKGMGSVGRHLIPVVGSFGELSENMRLEQIANKPAEKRTEDETTLLNTVALINTMGMEGIKGENAYQYGQAFGMMVPYVGEFVVTTPGYTAGKAVTKKLVLNTLSKVGVPEAVATGVSKVAGFGAGTLAQATLNPQRIMAETERRRTPQMAAVVDLDEKEINSLVELKEGEGFGEAFVKAYGTTWSEFMTERFGEVLGMGSKAFKNSKVGKKLLETGAFEKMTLAQFLKIKGIKTPYTAEVIKKATGRAGWHGVITEVWGEELPNMVINAAITGDMPIEEAMNPVSQELLDMVVPAMVMSGAFYSPVALEQIVETYEEKRHSERLKKWELRYEEALKEGKVEEPLKVFKEKVEGLFEVRKQVEKEGVETKAKKLAEEIPTQELKKDVEPVKEPVEKVPAPSVEGPKGEVKIGIPPQEVPTPPKYKRVYNNEATLTGKEKISLQKDNIEKSTYEPTSGVLLEKEVNRMYKENDKEEVENQIMDLSNDMTVPLRRRAASFTAKKYMEEGNDAEFVKFNRLARSLRTEAGKTLALSQFENQGVEAATEIIASAIETNQGRLEEKGVGGKTVQENITEDYKKARDLAAKIGVEISENEPLHSVIDKIISKITPKKKTTKQRIAKAKSTRQKLTKEYKNRKKDLFTAAIIPGVTPEGVEYIRKVAATYVDEGIARIEELTKKVADHIKKEFGVNVDPKKLETVLGEVAGERLVKGHKKEIGEIIKKHYSKEGAKETLVQRITEELGVDEKAAKEISAHIGEAFDKAVREESEKFLGKALALPKTKEKGEAKTELDRMMEALNAGALDQEQYQQMFSEKYGLKSLETGDIKVLKGHLDGIATAKSDFEKRDLTYQLMLELLRMDIEDKHWLGQVWNGLLGTWYMNILSGPGTHALNTFANLMETISELFIMIGKDPQRTDVYLASLARGVVRTGLVEALVTMVKGVPIAKAHKLEMPTEVEATKMMDPKKILDKNAINTIGNVLRALNALRVGIMREASTRLLSAVDAVFFSGLKELKEAQLAYSIAAIEKQGANVGRKVKGLGIHDLKTEIKPNESVRQRARYILNMSQATKTEVSDIKKAKAQARKEGYTGIPFMRKVNEIIGKKRAETSEDILFISRDFASRGTFNYPPEGVVGVFSRGMAQVGDMFTPFKSVVPFTRVIANVMNRYLDYTPYGMLRATGFNVGRVYDKVNNTKDAMKLYKHGLTEEEKIDLAMKASMGTIVMLLAYMFAGDEEGDLFEVTADGTGDLYKNFDLAESGWQEFSVKIGDVWYSYKNTPLGIGMAVIGYMKDMEKYKKGTREENIALIASSMSAYMMDMSFLNGMEEFLKLLTADKQGKDPSKAWERWWANKAKGVVIPNAWTQSYRAYQQYNDMPMKEAKEFWHYFIRDIPYVRDRLGIIYNSWGEPVVADQIKKFLPLTPKAVGKRDPVIWAANIDAKKFINTPSQPYWIEDEDTYTDYKVLRAQNIYDLLKNDELYKGIPLYETLGLMGKKGGTMEEYKKGGYGKEIQRFIKSNPKAETKDVHAFMSEIVDDEWRSVVSDAGTVADNELYFKEHPDEGTYKRKRWQREK